MAEYMLSVGALAIRQSNRGQSVPFQVWSAMLMSGFTASFLFAVMYSFEIHCGLICRLHSFLSSHMYNPLPSRVSVT
jgi:hypothetical protein